MRFIKTYKIFEQDSATLDTKKIDQDPIIFKWLGNCWLENPTDLAFDDYGENFITAPYGEKIKLSFEPTFEYTGEGDWSVRANAQDEYGIKYYVSGNVKGKVFHEDDIPDHDVDYDEDLEAYIGYKEFDPIKFFSGMITKEPTIATRVFQLVPEDIQKKCLEELKRLNISTDLVVGSKIINRFGNI